MKTKLPFRMCLRLGLQGKWVTKCFAVLLSAMSFMLFAIASTAFTYIRFAGRRTERPRLFRGVEGSLFGRA
mgnify:FL=1